MVNSFISNIASQGNYLRLQWTVWQILNIGTEHTRTVYTDQP